jgi:hypothetical protein
MPPAQRAYILGQAQQPGLRRHNPGASVIRLFTRQTSEQRALSSESPLLERSLLAAAGYGRSVLSTLVGFLRQLTPEGRRKGLEGKALQALAEQDFEVRGWEVLDPGQARPQRELTPPPASQ